MKLELISFQRKSWFIPVLARDLNDCMDDEQAFLKEIMEKMRELHTRCTHLFFWMNRLFTMANGSGPAL